VAAGATVTREAGIEFVTIPLAGRTAGAANPAWPGNGRPDDRAIGRGSVGYEYRIGRYEVTTAQWVEFINAALDRPAGDAIPWARVPNIWGASPTTPTNAGGQRFTYSAQTAMYGVGTVTWRMAAVYCNWLHNDKRTDRDAFLSGAYDVSTFVDGPTGPTDQLTRSPGARYFIPTLDEWVKAAHYDPSRLDVPVSPNAGGAGYWIRPTGSDLSPVYAPPGVNGIGGVWGSGPGQSSTGWGSQQYPGFSPFSTPLGAYASVMSPWGLFDTSGATAEWTESQIPLTGLRRLGGSSWTSSAVDLLGSFAALSPSEINLIAGFRVASLVPSPGGVLPLGLVGLLVVRRRR
jgi:formylglycine-generating enzyme required for sulfatase activity